DMQEDKELTFLAFDALDLCLASMTGMVSSWTVDKPAMRAAAAHGFSTATDLADYLVRELGLPFREAHHVTGATVKLAEDNGCDLAELSIDDLKSIEPRLTDAVYSVLTVEASVNSRQSYGGTSPVRVREQVSRWKELLS
ncbi:MAG TPA: argininosuccinate lyase, partial [Hyphomonadaceae bacterium]|nr:argininosuccinate lyase [Hyphomonadaceae bacterium]